ncbi:MAG: RHS repeat-associated core domain-containing protein, partial [Treponema sp.]|jgi:YD repeat-containing protein|nr:RHS repeat-associated core domain-containing protein [Treponema sp.]
LEAGYDLLGRRTSLKTPDMGLKKYGYDEAGNLVWEEDEVLRKEGVKINYVYDGLNRLREVVLPRRKDQRVNTNTVYEYGEPGAAGNAANRITKIADESGTVEYGYGKLGQTDYEKRVIYSLNTSRVDREVSGVMEYLSDYLGRMERIKYPDGEEVSYYYDNGGQIQKVQGKKPYYTEPYEYVKDIGYDEYGQRIYIEYGNGVQTRYTYDPLRRWLRAIETTGEGQVYQYINYEFDNENNF